MRLRKLRVSEAGYLLLENLVTLTILALILIIIYPLITDWMILREESKAAVEQARALYENSMKWPQQAHDDSHYLVNSTSKSLTVVKDNIKMSVEIYEAEFKE